MRINHLFDQLHSSEL